MVKAKIKPSLIRRNTDQSAMQAALGSGPKIQSEAGSFPSQTIATDSESSEQFVIGQTYAVPLYKLQKSENNARVFYSGEELDEMSKSLSEKGQRIPAIGYHRDGRVIVIDGQKRFQAATNAGMSSLQVMLIEPPVSESEEYEESRRINLQRSSQTPLDDAVRWQAMIAKGTYVSQDQLAERMGVSKANISKTLGINRIPERLLRMMSDHPQTRAMTIAYEISNIFAAETFKDKGNGHPPTTPDEAEYLAQEVIEETIKKEMGRAQVKALIDNKLQGPRTRERAESTVIKYGENKGTLKVFPSRGQLDLSFKDLPLNKVEELKTRIEQMLAGQLNL